MLLAILPVGAFSGGIGCSIFAQDFNILGTPPPESSKWEN